MRPRNGGVGRSSSPAAERVSDDLRRGTGSFLGLVSAGVTLVLAGMGDRDRTRTSPWVAVALAAKTAADAGGGLYLLAEQITKRRKVCSWGTLAALAELATFPIALPEARAAVHRLRGRS